MRRGLLARALCAFGSILLVAGCGGGSFEPLPAAVPPATQAPSGHSTREERAPAAPEVEPADATTSTAALTANKRAPIAISPASAALLTGQTQQFIASGYRVTRAPRQGGAAVVWSVNGIAGGNSTVGTISASGLYTAPAVATTAVTVTATTRVAPAESASATVVLSNPAPVLTSIAPDILPAGSPATELVVTGSGFTPQSVVKSDQATLATTFVNTSELHGSLPAGLLASARTLAISVLTPGPGGGATAAKPLTVHLVISITPSAPAPLIVNATLQFTANVLGSSDGGATWSVNGITGGNAQVGTISAGLYTAPAVPPVPNTVTVRATSTADPAQSATAAVAVQFPAPVLGSISPSSVAAGSGDLPVTLAGSGFVPASQVRSGSTGLATQFVSAGELRATMPAALLAAAGNQPLEVVTPAPGGGTSAPKNLAVHLVVSITPAAPAAIVVNESVQFTAVVGGSPNQGVGWKVNGVAGGDATVGTIRSGLYTAPAVPPSPNSVTISATSAADPGQSAAVTLAINNPAPTLAQVTPDVLPAGGGDTTVTLSGSGFTPQSEARVNAAGLATSFVSSSNLSATIPSAMLISAGTIPLTVFTPAPGGGSTAAQSLTIHVVVALAPAAPAPVLVGQSLTFTASVAGTSDQSVRWYVNGVRDGDSTVGRMSANVYTAPAIPPLPNAVTVTAASRVDPAQSASVAITVVNPQPELAALNPASVPAGSSTAYVTLTGSGFTPQSEVRGDGILLESTYLGGGEMEAEIPSAMLGSVGEVMLMVINPAPGGGTSVARHFDVLANVRIKPANDTVKLNGVVQFSATVYGAMDQSVTWTVNGIAGGNSAVGTISASGLYIAPGAPLEQVVQVGAASVAEPALVGTTSASIIIPPSEIYPRANAGSVLRASPPLPLVPSSGTTVAVLEWQSRDPEGTEEDVMAACQILTPFAIPHIHTASLAEAVQHPFLVVVATLPQGGVSAAEEDALQAYVQSGGTLLLWRTMDTGLLGRFGLTPLAGFSGPTVRELTFDVGTADPALRFIDADEEVNWTMAYHTNSLTRGYGGGVALARWVQTGEAGVVRSDSGAGRVYVFGWRLAQILGKNLRLIVVGEEPPWTSYPVLDSDIVRLMMRAIYEQWAPEPQVRQFAPGGKPAALVITHDADAKVSYARTGEFVAAESGRSLKSTFLFTTGPFGNGWIETMYDPSGLQDIQLALDQGFDVQSHSFGHFDDFYKAPFTNGTEDAAHYFPRYSELIGTVGESAVGELGVSRWLLEEDFPIRVESYRSGHLHIPQRFLEALSITGYRRDTSYAAGVTRGSLPFPGFTFSGSTGARLFPVMEYPVSMTDDGLDESNYQGYLDRWDRLIRINYANNVPTVLLIHTSTKPLRLEAEHWILDRVSDLDLWIGDWKTFAEAWEQQGVTCDRWAQ